MMTFVSFAVACSHKSAVPAWQTREVGRCPPGRDGSAAICQVS
jgi:hypothetical protein